MIEAVVSVVYLTYEKEAKMSRKKLNGLFALAKEMRKAGAITAAEYGRIMEYLKKLSSKIGG